MTPLDSTIIVAIITGGFALLGTALTVHAGNNKNSQMLKLNQAVTEERISELTREVRRHNEFASRIPKLEQRIDDMEKDIKKLEEKND